MISLAKARCELSVSGSGPRAPGQAASVTGEIRSTRAAAEFELHASDIRKT